MHHSTTSPVHHTPAYAYVCSTLSSDTDDNQPTVSNRNAQYKNNKRENKRLKKEIRDIKDKIRELLKNKDVALKVSRLRGLEFF